MTPRNIYERAIIRNADWFLAHQQREGFIDVEGDEFYGLKGDATLIGHSVTVRLYAYLLSGDERYRESALASLTWLAERQDERGGWRHHAAFTLDGAQCVFEGFNTYERVTGDRRFRNVLLRAARRMITGTIDEEGCLLLPNLIEIGEYAHFALLAWKTTGDEDFRRAGETILGHILRHFDEEEGYWLPLDPACRRQDPPARVMRPLLRWAVRRFPMRGRLVARMAEHMLPIVAGEPRPQYAMSMMDAEALLDSLDGSCQLPALARQTERAIRWVTGHCEGPFPGSLVESPSRPPKAWVFPLPLINDNRLAALWPTTCLLIAYCGLRNERFREPARVVADWIVSMQDKDGGFFNFRRPDGRPLPLKSGNVNFYATMALWIYNEVYENGPARLFTARNPVSTAAGRERGEA